MPPSSLKTENRNTGGNDPYITGGNEEGLTRLQFILLSTLAAAGATGALLAPDIGKVSSNLDLSVVESLDFIKQEALDAILIDYSVVNRREWRCLVKFYEGLEAQKYDLSCEANALLITLILSGAVNPNDPNSNVTEDDLIDMVPKSADPNEGFHPNLRNVLNGAVNSRAGGLPPDVWGITPRALWENISLRYSGLRYVDNLGSSFGEHGKFENNANMYLNILKGLIYEGIPAMVWLQTKPGKVIEYKGYPAAQNEHVMVIVGFGKDTFLAINPVDLKMYRITSEELINFAFPAGAGIMWLEQ